MTNLNNHQLDFLKYYTVNKKEVMEHRKYNKQKLLDFGFLGTKLVNPLLIKFLDCEEISVLWSCEGYNDAPKYKFKFPHLGFLVTQQGLNQLLCYLENCRKELAITSESWIVNFHHATVNKDLILPIVDWNFYSHFQNIRREFIFKTMCEEFDLYFK